ncbi:MAG: hypothetical protein KBD53_02100 [Candidatus Omnitrophica bacterium]|nr:hypothetical protein [Candidatus Omnitrophota bacterium]
MKIRMFIFSLISLFLITPSTQAIEGLLATPETILQLRKDLRDNHIRVGYTRLHEIIENYGKALSITDDDRRVVFEYDDIRTEFVKNRLWRSWTYDGFRKPVYTQDVDKLRFDLESEELVGDNITIAKIVKDYGEPTESAVSEEDGQETVYYYGDIKLVFENVFVLRSWKAQNLADNAPAEGNISTPEIVANTVAPEATKKVTPEPTTKTTPEVANQGK